MNKMRLITLIFVSLICFSIQALSLEQRIDKAEDELEHLMKSERKMWFRLMKIDEEVDETQESINQATMQSNHKDDDDDDDDDMDDDEDDEDDI